jgi:hypothetical protein
MMEMMMVSKGEEALPACHYFKKSKTFDFQAPPFDLSRLEFVQCDADRRLAWPKIHQNYEVFDALIGLDIIHTLAQVMMSSAKANHVVAPQP